MVERVHVYSDLESLDPVAWDGLLGRRGFYSSSGWLRHAHATAGAAPAYLVAERDGRYTGVLATYPLDADSPYVFCRADRVLARALGDTVPHDLTTAVLPTLLCGGRNPSHARLGAVAGPAGDPTRARLILRAEQVARDRGLRSVGFLYVDDDDTALRAALEATGYLDFPSDVAFSLPIAGQSFTGYLSRLSRSRRNKVHRELRDLEQGRVEYRHVPLTDELIERIAPLELALYRRHGTPADAGAFAAVLGGIARNLVGESHLVLAEVEGQLAGFVLVFQFRDELYARQVGFDYDRKGTLPLYFGLVYYHLVEFAHRIGVRRIFYSTGSPTVKLSRGCEPIGQTGYLKCFDPKLHDQLRDVTARLRSQRGLRFNSALPGPN